MKATTRGSRLGGLVWSVGLALSLVLCASVRADDQDKNVVSSRHEVAQRMQMRQYTAPKRYVITTASAIPVPVERYGEPPTTTSPLIVIRGYKN